MSLFGGGKASTCVMSKGLYDHQKAANDIYRLKQRLCPKGEETVYVAFKNPEPFLTEITPSDKEKKAAEKLAKQLVITVDEALDLMLAKKAGCTLMTSSKQVWLQNAAKKNGIKVDFFR